MKPVVICQLYHDIMSTYGDRGNVYYLAYFLRQQAIESQIINHGYGDPIPEADIYVFGGGQDAAQELVAQDLLGDNGKQLFAYLEDHYCLSVCGGYQLLGKFYLPHSGHMLEGLNFLPVTTIASSERFVGPVIISRQFNGRERTIVGFENHSGKTQILDDSPPLGTIIKGGGNNGQDGGEGIVYKKTIGTYLHGPLLPRNPHLVYWWLKDLLHNYAVPEQPNLELEQAAHHAYLDMTL